MKNKNGLYLILFLVLMVFLLLPIIQQAFHPFKLEKLTGAVVETERPTLSYDTYKNMSYQAQLEKYMAEHFGFREPVIRIYNQYLWAFRKTYSQDVVIGKDKWLYGKKSVLDHYRQIASSFADSDEALVKQLNYETNRLKRLQDLLDERDTKLFVLICPSKDLVYPEYLPEGHGFVMGDRMRAVEYVPEVFAQNGIRFIDMNAWFQQIKDTVDYPLFPKTGMHWSNVAAMHVSDTLIRYMEKLTGKNMLNIQVDSMYSSEPIKPDNDLEKTMNLIWPIQPNQNYYAKVNVIPDSTAWRPRLIAVGDSFFWNICYTLPMDRIFNSYSYWYYFNTVYFDPRHDNVKQLNIVEEVDNADFVLIILTTNHLYNFNQGFLTRLDQAFSNPYPEAVETIIHKMEADSVWYQSLKEKAERKGKTLDEVMREDALYLIKSNPEKYRKSE